MMMIFCFYPNQSHQTPRPDSTSTTQSGPRRSRTTAPNISGVRRSHAGRIRHLHELRNPATRLFMFSGYNFLIYGNSLK
jgi:hypothetical protein